MYTIVWKKYLPVIKILMKKAAGGDQLLGLNRSDFEKEKVAKKSNVRFTVNMVNGNARNAAGIAPIGREFVTVLQEDGAVSELMRHNDFVFNLSNRYELGIHLEPRAPRPSDEEPELVAKSDEDGEQ